MADSSNNAVVAVVAVVAIVIVIFLAMNLMNWYPMNNADDNGGINVSVGLPDGENSSSGN